MKTLKLKNAKLEILTENKVSFIGEIKNRKSRFSMTITDIKRYYDLLQLDRESIYNIWFENGNYRFILKG